MNNYKTDRSGAKNQVEQNFQNSEKQGNLTCEGCFIKIFQMLRHGLLNKCWLPAWAP